ncbi:MAG: S-layer homology domain-containing protein [Oscillospiraceae bacterium]|nr:S-layer homology domain-containing protein [Oscillospiraceae bacterium]
MKNTKRILIFALVIAFAITMLPMAIVANTDDNVPETVAPALGGAPNFSDVPNTSAHYQAITVLAAFDVIRGFPGGTFGPTMNVTRAEFTAMLMRTMNLDGIGDTTGELPFTDISDPNVVWAIPNIITASGMGIVNGVGDGLFAPNENVLFEQAVTMIVRALGYSVVAADRPGDAWYSGFISVGHQQGVLDRSGGTVNAPATRQTIAQLLYNSLEVRILEQRGDNWVTSDRTFLRDFLNLVRNSGVVSANNDTGLDRPNVVMRAGEIQIRATEPGTNRVETHNYRTENPSEFYPLLGQEVTFYYSLNAAAGVRDLILAIPSPRTRITTIAASALDVSPSSNTSIRYFRNEADRNSVSLAIDPNNVVIFNGRLYGSTAANSRFRPNMLPRVGEVRAIDSNGSGAADIIFINSYEVLVVRTINSNQHQIIDTNTPHFDANGNPSTVARERELNVNSGDYDLRIINRNGQTVNFGSIVPWNIVHLRESNRGNGARQLRVAVVVNDVVTGSVSSSSQDSITVGGRTLNFSAVAAWDINVASNPVPRPQVGDSGRFFLDIEGNVVMWDRTAATTNEIIGYIMGVRTGGGGLGTDFVELNIRQSNGQIQERRLAQNVRINGTTQTGVTNQRTALRASAALQNQDPGAFPDERVDYTQLIRFETAVVSGQTVITDMITVRPNNPGAGDVNIDLVLAPNVTGREFTFTSPGNLTAPASGGRPAVNLIVTAETFVFVVPTNRTLTDQFRVQRPAQAFRNNVSGYSIAAFNVTPAGVARFVVLFGGVPDRIDATTGVVMFNQTIQTTGVAGPAPHLQGRYLASGRNGGAARNVQIEIAAGAVVRDFSENPSGVVVANGVAGLRRGDILRYGTNSQEQIDEIHVLSRATVQRGSSFLDDLDSSVIPGNSQFRFMRGSVYARDVNPDGQVSVLIMSDQVLASGNANHTGNTTGALMRPDFNNATFMSLSIGSGETRIYDSNIAMLDGLMSFDEVRGTTVRPSELIVYMSEGVVRLVVRIDPPTN